jgi:hypothetical protein
MRDSCTLKAALTRLGPSLCLRAGINGRTYYSIPLEVVLELGRTQLLARLQWKEGVSDFNGSSACL